MSQEERQAKVLADWLSGPPGTPPPAGLDPEVVESVFALRPDLAPPPAVGADDILALVTSGPLASGGAAPGEGEVVAFPGSGGAGPVIPANEPAGVARGRPWWAIGGGAATLLAAAATMLVIALPAMRGELEAPEMAAKGPAAPETYAEDKSVPPPDRPAQTAARMKRPASSSSRPASTPKPVMKPSSRSGPLRRAARPEAEPVEEAVAALSDTGDRKRNKDADNTAVGGLLGGEATADATLEMERQSVASREVIPEVQAAKEWGYGQAPQGAAVAELSEDEADAPEQDFDQYDDLAGDMEGEETESLDRVSRRRPAKSKPKRDRAESKMEEPAAAPDAGVRSDERSDLSQLRAAAMPRDLNRTGWTYSVDGLTLDTLTETRNRADQLAREGRLNDAGDALASEVNPPVGAGQEFAAQAAERYLAAGNAGAALQAAQRGLALSTANSAIRSYLLVLLGDAHLRLGNPEGARSAWEQANGLNRAR